MIKNFTSKYLHLIKLGGEVIETWLHPMQNIGPRALESNIPGPDLELIRFHKLIHLLRAEQTVAEDVCCHTVIMVQVNEERFALEA